jgi:hypothetical protein
MWYVESSFDSLNYSLKYLITAQWTNIWQAHRDAFSDHGLPTCKPNRTNPNLASCILALLTLDREYANYEQQAEVRCLKM